MDLVFKSFDKKTYIARNYQIDAYQDVRSNENYKHLNYNKNGYIFTLNIINMFPTLYSIKNDKKELVGILGPKDDFINLKLKIGKPGSAHNFNGTTLNSGVTFEYTKTNLLMYYLGAVVPIRRGSRIYKYKGDVMVGWHGSYDPPHGM